MSDTDDDTPMVNTRADHPKLEHGFPGLAEAHRFERDTAHQQLSYLSERRDKLTERILFGLLTLNGASLLALMTSLGGSGEAARWLGFTPDTAIFSAAAFAVGLVLAGFAVTRQQIAYMSETGDAFKRAGAFRDMVMRYKEPSTVKSVEELGAALDGLVGLPHVGFQYSNAALVAQNFSGTAWFVGIAIPLLTALIFSR